MNIHWISYTTDAENVEWMLKNNTESPHPAVCLLYGWGLPNPKVPKSLHLSLLIIKSELLTDQTLAWAWPTLYHLIWSLSLFLSQISLSLSHTKTPKDLRMTWFPKHLKMLGWTWFPINPLIPLNSFSTLKVVSNLSYQEDLINVSLLKNWITMLKCKYLKSQKV